MKQNLQTSGTEPTKKIWQINAAQFSLYAVISILLLVAFNGPAIWDYFNQNVLVQQGTFQNAVDQNSSFYKLFGSLAASRVPLFVFWIIVGCGIYLMVWLLRNIYINLRNDMVADDYVHPASYSRSNYWSSVLGRKIFLVTSWLLLMGSLFASSFGLMPALAKLAREAVSSFSLPSSAMQLLAALAVTTGLIYVLVVLLRLSVYASRAVFKGF